MTDPLNPTPGALSGMLEWLTQLVPQQRNRPQQYLVVLGLVVFALWARLAIAPIEGGIQYVTFFPTVAVSAVLGGLWPGLFSALLGMLLASFFFWPPYQSLNFAFNSHMLISNLVFMVDAVIVCMTIEAMHRYLQRYVDAERELQLAANVFEHSSEGVIVTDIHSTILSVNPAFSAITGYSREEVLGRKPSLLRSDHHAPEFYQQLWQTLLQEGQWQGEIWNRRKSGEAFLEWITINRVGNHQPEQVRYVGVFHDITEQRRQHERIRHMAFHDALTGLPNRALFQERLSHAIAHATREEGQLSVTFIDLDGFKQVNDRLGHDVGDLLLQQVAQRLTRQMRRGTDTVARLGGDEFVILMEDLKEPAHCAALASEILRSLQQPLQLRGHDLHIGASMGIAFYPTDGDNAQRLMQRADMAMYAAKNSGKGSFRYFQPEMETEIAQ